MVDTLPNVQVVYNKWQNRCPLTSTSQGGMKSTESPKFDQFITTERQTWHDRYGRNIHSVSSRNGYLHTSRRKRDLQAASAFRDRTQGVAWFKRQPVISPVIGCFRPFAARCCTCMPDSRNQFYDESLKSLGVTDIFDVQTKYSEDWLTRTFCHMSFVLQRPLLHKYPDVSIAVLTSQRLRQAVQLSMKDSADIKSECGIGGDESTRQIERHASSVLRQLSAKINNHLVRFTGWFLHKLLGRLLSTVVVHRGQMEMLRLACKRGRPVIFLPTHRSHLDYILITFILFHYEIRAPHVAAGDNLLIPFFGSLMRGLGGFFIRRKLDLIVGQRDHVYRAVLQTYMEQLLCNGEFLEFFVEGGRTRSGKPVAPKGGLLSVVVDAVASENIEDAYIVPVSISYDRLVDGNFVKEQMGEPKVYETFWRACLAIYRVLMSFYGIVRVDFSQPFSVKEYMTVCKKYPNSDDLTSQSGTTAVIDSDRPVASSSGSSLMSVLSLCPTVSECCVDTTIGDSRRMIQQLAEHVVHAATRSLSATSSHLCASLLLIEYRQGVSLPELVKAFDWLKDEVISHEHDVSFTGETIDVIFHAQRMLGNHLLTMDPPPDVAALLSEEQLNAVRLAPVTSLPNVFELAYYANVLAPIFAVESVVVNALYSLVTKDAWLQHTYERPIIVARNQLISRACQLCTILRYEFVFAPPCKTVENVVIEAVDNLHFTGLLVTVKELGTSADPTVSTEEQLWAERFAQHNNFGFEDSDDDDELLDARSDSYIELSTDAESLRKFTFLRRILSPLIETYYATACHLTVLQHAVMPERDFTRSLQRSIRDRISSGLTPYAESVALDTIKNSVHSFRHSGVVELYDVADLSMMTLSAAYHNDQLLDDLIHHLESYRD